MKVCILGSGAYGIALASILVSNKKEVIMWTINEEEAKFLNEKRESKKLEGYKIDKNIEITTDMEKAVLGSDLIVISVPAFAFESTVVKLKKYIYKSQRVLIATKGIQQDTCLFLSDVFHKYLKNIRIFY